MRTIDADYIINIVNEWQDMFNDDSVEYKMIAQFKNCINAQNTVIDVQEIINDIQDEKILDYEGLSTQDIKSAVIYNDGLEYGIHMIKNHINPNLRDNFSFCKEDAEKEEYYDYE